MNSPAKNRHPKSARAFTLVELLLVLGVLSLLALLLLPAFDGRPIHAPKMHCVNNLKQTGNALLMWATDHDGRFPMQVSVTNDGTMELVATGAVFVHFQVLSNELRMPDTLCCLADKERTRARSFTNMTDANLSYFVGLDATTNEPSTTLLSGDRNLTNQPSGGSRFVNVTKTTALGWTKELHSRHGNLLFADGSVIAYDNKDVKANSQMPEGVTNRLVIP